MSESTLPPEPLRPLGKRVLVQQKPFSDKVAGGLLVIPQGFAGSRMGYEDRATVIAIGPKATLDVKAGDVVIFSRQPGAQINPDSQIQDRKWDDFLLLDEDSILAVVEDATAA